MNHHAQLLETALKANNYSLTSARQAVYAVLAANEPLTMHELIAACPKEIDRSSVYRSIQLFEKLGIVQRLQIGWKYRLELSNDFQDHHHHATCSQCGKVIALPEDTALEQALESIAASVKFIAKDHQIEIRGICADCKQLKT